MLFLLFEIGEDRYCLDVSRVIEVAPIVAFKKLPYAPAYVSGLMNYRGTTVPVIDLSALLGATPSRPLFSTRIIMVDFTGADNTHHVIGLLAEKVTETISRREDDFQPPGIVVDEARFLGKIIHDERGMIQRVETTQLLPESMQKYLFAAKEEQ
ncbi:MAG: Chemotaxis protein CheW [Syntrophorhabdaceae bacterium PtaU1.Bin034]|jgi:chemotaxis-related protein WspB|nr:MAG: Chemotaxis protein CheW [Syntrophorhabdaceae bacterium PtaU1.Bin034]